MCLYLSMGCVGHLSSQACPGGSEVDLCNHRNCIRGDEGCGIPCCHEEAEVLIVINNFVSYLNHISRTCVCVCVHMCRSWTEKERVSVSNISNIHCIIKASGRYTIYFILSSTLYSRCLCLAYFFILINTTFMWITCPFLTLCVSPLFLVQVQIDLRLFLDDSYLHESSSFSQLCFQPMFICAYRIKVAFGKCEWYLSLETKTWKVKSGWIQREPCMTHKMHFCGSLKFF